MANLKPITEVQEVTQLNGTEKVLLNVDGEAKQANINLITPSGGGNSGEPDIVIELHSPQGPDEQVTVEIVGTYNHAEMVEKIRNNKIVNPLIFYQDTRTSGPGAGERGQCFPVFCSVSPEVPDPHAVGDTGNYIVFVALLRNSFFTIGLSKEGVTSFSTLEG